MQALTRAVIAVAFIVPATAMAQQQDGSSRGSQFQKESNSASRNQDSNTASRSSESDRRRGDQQTPGSEARTGSAADQERGTILLTTWSYAPLYTDGWSARALYHDTTVLGPYGDDIGSVENLILSDQGKVLGVIAEVGGFLDIGDTHLFVPWEKVKINSDLSRITIPVTQETAENYTFADSYIWRGESKQLQAVESSLETGPSVWKLSDVLGDYAYLSEGVGYGYINDVIISRAGDVQALVVKPDLTYGYRYGYRALPWRGYRPYGVGPYYNLGYRKDEVERLSPLDLSRITGATPAKRETSSAAAQTESGKNNRN